jgi:chromosome segregation ATPase
VTFVGRPLSLAVVVALCVLAAGTVGATVLYSSGVTEVETQNQQLRSQNEQLREDLASARDRIGSLEDRVESLRRQLQSKNETLSDVRAERDAARSDLRAVCDRVRGENVSLPEECEGVGSE